MKEKKESISEKTKLEQDLRKTRDFLIETERTAKIGGWQIDPATMEQTWTDEVFRILEIDITDGAPMVPQGLEFIDPEFRPMAEKAIQKAMEFGEPYNQEWIITTSKGNKKWVNAVCKPIMKEGKLVSISGSFQDISSRKKTELELRESEEKLRVVLDNSPFPTAVVDEHDQNILYWSKSAIELFGHNPRTTEEWYESAYPDPKYRDEVIKRWKPFLKIAQKEKRVINTGEYEIHCKNGSIKICEIYAQFIPGNLIVTLNDITERKKSEEKLLALNQQLRANDQQLSAANQQLRANEQQLRAANEELSEAKQKSDKNAAMLIAAMENSQAGIAIADVPSGKLSYVNKSALLIRDKDYDEIVKNIDVDKYVESWQILHMDGTPYERDEVPLAKAVLYGESSSREFIVRRDNNEDRYVLANAAPVFAESGRQIAAIVVFLDITERKLAEQKLLQNQYYLSKAQEIGKIGTWELDILKNRLIWTDENYKIFGIPVGTPLTYELFLNSIHPDDREYVDKEWKASLENKPYDIEHRLLVNDEVKWVREKADIEYDDRGNAIRAIGFTQDITERKRIESELVEAKEKAEESDRLKSAFLANMSHEIRTPMNGILGFTDLLKESELNNENKQDFINVIEKSGHRLLNTVNDLIDISKIESGQMKVSVNDFDISILCEDLFNFYRIEAAEKGLKLNLNRSSLDNCVIRSDQEKIYSILSNLIKNAMKYTDAGSIEFGYHKKDDKLQFFVKDTGKGIPGGLFESVFERFTRLEDNNLTEGSGLGLSISKAYVEMLGGKIWVESEAGKGSQFYFIIPYAASTNSTEAAEDRTKSMMGVRSLKILIAEDDIISYNHLSIILKNLEHKIIHSTSGSEIIKLCRDNPDIDLILMDVKMPGMNGLEVTKRIREFNKHVIIIAQTAFALTGDKKKALDAGCNDYITKPINKGELLNKIGSIFR